MRFCPRCKTPYTTAVEHCGLDGEKLVDTGDDLLLGTTIDRYEIVNRLGGGAMAAVYRARHQVIDREVAVKVLFGEFASDKQFAERFRREAQAASRIKHKNVVEVLDFGETPAGASFLLMELLSGHSLHEAIQLGGAMSPRRASRIARDIAEGLTAAHAMGFIHRDLKPGNIFLFDDDGREGAKILDFGVVHVAPLEQAVGEQRLTLTGQTLGTPYYMAPEQIAGDGKLTERTDLYALGVVIYEMLQGSSPFRGSLGEVLVKHVSEKPAKLPPAGGLEKLVKRLLEKDPKKRPPNAHAVVNEIDRLDLGGPVKFVSLDQTLPPMAEHAEPVDVTAAPHTLNLGDDDVLDPGDLDEDVTTEAFRPYAPDTGPRSIPVGRNRAAAPSRLPVAVAALLALVALGGLVSVLLEEPSASSEAMDPTPRAARLDELLREAEAAANARGLLLREAGLLDEVAPIYERFRAALDRHDLALAKAAADELVPALARTPLPPKLLERKLARVQTTLEDGSLPLDEKQRKELMKTLLSLRQETERELTEAERSQLALRLHQIERSVGSR